MRVQIITPDERAVRPGRRKVYTPTASLLPAVLTIPFGKLVFTGFPPTVTERANGTVIYINGVDVSQYVFAGSTALRIQKQTIGRATCTLDFIAPSGGFTPAIAQTIRIVDWGRTLFSGVLQTVQTDRQGVAERNTGVSTIFYHCTAKDRASICDHRLVLKDYALPVSPAPPVDWSAIILDIVANFLNNEGITTGGVVGSYGFQDVNLNWGSTLPTVTQAFDEIAKDAGLMWWIDQNGVLFFSSLANLPAAPFGLIELGLNGSVGSWISLKVTTDLSTFYNKIYAVGNRNVQPTSSSTGNDESWNMIDSWPNVIPNPNDPLLNQGDSIAIGVRTSQPVSSITSILRNNIHPQSFYTHAQFHGQAPLDAFDLIWLYDVGSNEIRWVHAPQFSGDIVEVKYTPVTPGSNPMTNLSGASAQTPLVGTMGSGIYEGTIQVANYDTLADLDADAAAALTRLGGIPTIADIEIDVPGLEPGQLINVNVPLSGITNKNLLITQVTHDWQVGDLGQQFGFHSNFRNTIQARSNLDPGNWMKWFERQFGRTTNQLPIPNYEEAVFTIATDGSTTPIWPVGRTGPVFQVLLVCASSISPADFILSIYRTQTDLSRHLVTSFTVPGGFGGFLANTARVFTVAGSVVNATDTLQVVVTNTSGGSMTFAAAIVCKARWQVA